MSIFEVVELDTRNENIKERIVFLRKSEYSKTFQSCVDLEKLRWNSVDNKAMHFGLIFQSNIVSVLRLSFHNSDEDLENCTKIPSPKNLFYPVALLSRAATCENFQNKSLHSILRRSALSFCLKLQVNSVLGALEVSSLRFKQLQQIGYKVLAEEPTWKNSFIKSTGPVALVGLIGNSAIKKAIENLDSRVIASSSFSSDQHRSFE